MIRSNTLLIVTLSLASTAIWRTLNFEQITSVRGYNISYQTMADFTKSVSRLLKNLTLDQDSELIPEPELEEVISRDPSYSEFMEINGDSSFQALTMLYQRANSLAIE